VSIARWNHSDPIPNSEVKRCCGDDSLRVASCHNSSMPGFIFQHKKPSLLIKRGLFVCGNFLSHPISFNFSL
jgi:hypothetical protein